MNCKPGDLAMNVSGDPYCYGEIYSVLRAYDGPWIWTEARCPSWWVEHRGHQYHCTDSSLRPIRPGDIADDEVRELYAPNLPEVA